MTSYYDTNLQHISEEIRRVDLLIQLQVLKIRHKKEVVDGFQGLYVSEEEINSILDDTYPANDEDQHIQTLIERIAELEQELEAKKVESLKRGITLNLPQLANIFGLTPFELDVILICMAPELDTRYERLYAYLHNDATKKQPSVDLIIKILKLVYNTKEEKLYARQIFDVSAPLVKHLLIQFIEAPEEGKKSLLTRFIKVDDRIVNYILGFNQIDKKIEPFTELIRARTDLDELQLPEEQKRKINSLINRRELTDCTKCFLHGPYGVGKKTVAQCMCKELGMALLTVDIAYLINIDADFEVVISRSFREAMLQDSAVYLAHFDQLFSDDTKKEFYKSILFKTSEDFAGITFIASEQPLELDGAWQKDLFTIEIPIPDYAMRKQIWEQYLTVNFSEGDVSALANKFKFTAGQIKRRVCKCPETGCSARTRSYNSGRHL